ncbi:MAG: hypothetical protein KC421_15290 [Anaerolineales bacterium]|nr:hypothetical protein [Anaerolineales bacterium]
MQEYQEFTDLLSSHDHSLLEDLQVELGTTHVTFHKKLSKSELRMVWRTFTALKYRVGVHNDKINWALGDWMVQVDDWYGEGTVENWMEWMLSDIGLEPHRNEFYRLAGGTLIRLQSLEDTISDCCLILGFVGMKLSPKDFLSLSKKIRKQTLGQLVKSVKDKIKLNAEFELRLTDFVLNRNRFVHRLWFEEIRKSEFDHSLLEKLEQFCINLVNDCDYILKAFEGFRAILLQEIATSGKSSTLPERTPLLLNPGKWQLEAMMLAQSLFGQPK